MVGPQIVRQLIRLYFYQKVKIPYDWWLQDVLDIREDLNVTVGIDTPLAKAYQEQIRKAGISDVLFTTEEGKFSMYIDAVTNHYGRCSYEALQVMPRTKDSSSNRPDFDAVLKEYRTW